MAGLKRFAALGFSLLLVLVGLEFVSFIYLSYNARAFHSPAFYYERINQPMEAGGCSWGDRVSHHPYLALRYHHLPPCNRTDANKRGMLGEEIKPRKDDSFYNVLLLGGSVAELLFASNQLEEQFNKSLNAPNNRKFKVWNAAITAGQQPRQAIAHLLFGEHADMVISLEGFNEHFSYRSALPLEAPPQSWYELESVLQSAHGPNLLATNFPKALKYSSRRASHNLILRHSYFTVLLHTLAISNFGHTSAPKDVVAPYYGSDPLEARRAHLATYSNYLKSMGELSKGRSQQLFVFLQPVPALYKPLTDSDRGAATDLSYAQDYQNLVDGLVKNVVPRVKVIPILDTFKDYQGDLYIDLIHFREDSQGNEWLARRMVSEIAKQTGWKKK